ncbi:hypothetical protein DYB25_006633 [Aphanomyces astaci]|uniref:Mitochondrial import inner membrane translocase subunit Tim21 n=1 Tax=Aphanomyces astaci TaxID=112090 RepID=A0A397FJJ1_APHAT|nr:hypothetical protein DYB36_001973 [Aphanomyces astaci]RHY09895.1 hypothetical protein DYB25_006633 [Aphanomyces astaci]RHY57521.1 hypothetical protein DYB38_001177 [Aphanomyces astaci]RHY61512.1 hypothetical protein DYB30_003376 [Aphanomyces astaci]RHY78192.1 hypothetical protein DYB34_002022 [Aphanomyces astaci]
MMNAVLAPQQYMLRSPTIPQLLKPLAIVPSRRYYSSNNFDDWRRNTSLADKIKTGAVVVAGLGVFTLVSSGAYSLYQSFRHRGAFRALQQQHPFSSPDSPFGSIFHQLSKRQRGASRGMPLVATGLMTGLLRVFGGIFKQSWNRVVAVQTHVEATLQKHPSIRSQLGSNMSVSSPDQVTEQTVNGVGRLDARFPIVGGRHRAYVVVSASIDATSNRLTYHKLTYVNASTGETRDLLQEGGKASVVLDAEYREIH